MSSLADKPYYIVPTCHERVGTIYRDDHVLLINKPAYLLSVPGRAPENKDCAVRRLAIKDPDIRLVHRLDLDTSGIMVFALTRQAQSQLSRLFQQRTVKKRYQAVVHGLVEKDQGSIELPLIADWPNRPPPPATTPWSRSLQRHGHTAREDLPPRTRRTLPR